MGGITSILKGGAKSAMNQVKSMDVMGQLNSGLSSVGIDVPKLNMPDGVKNFKPSFNTDVIKLPAGVESYISPLASGLLSNAKLPSEFGGIQLPQLPDLSSVSSDINGYLSGIGLDTNQLGIRNIDDILKEPDLSSLKDVQFESPVDLDNMPDLTKSLDDFDMSGLQSQIDEITNQFPGVNIDISKYF